MVWSITSNASGTYGRCVQASTSNSSVSLLPLHIKSCPPIVVVGRTRRHFAQTGQHQRPARQGSRLSHDDDTDSAPVYERYQELASEIVKAPTSRKPVSRESNAEASSDSARPIPAWQAHREAMKAKFPEGWNPPRKVERGDMNTIRRLHAIDSDQWNTRRLADQFKISPEAVRRILKSKWRSDEELEEEAIGDQLERELAEDDEQGRNPVLQRSFRWVSSGSEAAGQDAAPPRPRATPLQEGFSAENSKWSARPHFDVKDVAYRQRLGGGSTRWSR